MGQTLTHGIYLPDEGERNCYDGLASNWQLLDGAVGTVAEHTSQIAGKAPAVHTHTKADITDFPAYGNTAGTICEGNDSRLSDARTPTSHAHGSITNDGKLGTASRALITDGNKKIAVSSVTSTELGYLSGVTSAVQDQLDGKAASNHVHGNITNDGKVGTTANLPLITGTGGVVQAGSFGNAANTFCEGNDSRLSDARTPVAHTHTKSDVTDLLNSNFIPSANNSYDLGSSSYQWNNLYAKNYYYNGTQWGLDKDNTWTGANTFQGNFYHKSGSSALVKGTNPSSVIYYGSFRHQTYAGEEINLFRGYIGTTGDNCYRWAVEPWVSGSNGRFQMRVSSDGSVRAFEVDGTEVSPYTDNATNLGTSTKRWKTFNGLNPGDLCMPTTSTTWEDTTGYVLDGVTENQMPLSGTFAVPGWLCFRVTHTLGTASFIRVETAYRVWALSDKDCLQTYTLWVPCRSNTSYSVICNGNSLQVRFHPCYGNV